MVKRNIKKQDITVLANLIYGISYSIIEILKA